LDIYKIIKKASRAKGASLIGFTTLNGGGAVVMGFSSEEGYDLLELDCRTKRLAEHIQLKGLRVKSILGSRENGVSLPRLDEDASLGFVGKNGLLITREFGPDLRLSAMIIDDSFPPLKKNNQNNGCGKCLLCQKACPIDAIRAKDVDNCRSYVENMTKGRCTVCIDVPYPEKLIC
jgi:epoxyqueuosine reductase QueG